MSYEANAGTIQISVIKYVQPIPLPTRCLTFSTLCLDVVVALFDTIHKDCGQELTLKKGNKIVVEEYHGNGWWKGKRHGQRGLFHQQFVQVRFFVEVR